MDTLDVVVVGGGPAGLSASIYALERKLKLIVLEAHKPGGQLINLYPDKDIYDLPAFEAIKARDLAKRIMDHSQKAGAELIQATVLEIEKTNSHFLLKTDAGEFKALSVILATGMGHYSPRRLNVFGETELLNKGVLYQSVPTKLTGKRVVVIGGGDTALETAVNAAEKGAAVMLVHRRESFRAQEKTVDRLKRMGVPMYLNAHVGKIHGSDRVEGVEITKENGGVSILSADFVSICIGVELNTSFLGKLGITVEKQAVVVDTDMQTSSPGIFACGDVVVSAGKYRRVSVAFGTAATAVNGVYQFLKHPYWEKGESNSQNKTDKQ